MKDSNAFYDRLLPNVVNKFFKGAKWGKARVGRGRIPRQGAC